mmetsp:Transcript_9710/g.36082  ORF Transcript_9710/g.36082 Transcript_9710/m.36082 type:complete len:150 (+) Transcript_9710:1204-1653(+)
MNKACTSPRNAPTISSSHPSVDATSSTCCRGKEVCGVTQNAFCQLTWQCCEKSAKLHKHCWKSSSTSFHHLRPNRTDCLHAHSQMLTLSRLEWLNLRNIPTACEECLLVTAIHHHIMLKNLKSQNCIGTFSTSASLNDILNVTIHVLQE